jgi:hypothetical protein
MKGLRHEMQPVIHPVAMKGFDPRAGEVHACTLPSPHRRPARAKDEHQCTPDTRDDMALHLGVVYQRGVVFQLGCFWKGLPLAAGPLPSVPGLTA